MRTQLQPGDVETGTSMFASLRLPRRRALVALGCGTMLTSSALIWAPHAIAASAVLALALAWASLIDIERHILPDVITLGLIVGGLALALSGPPAVLLARSAGVIAGYAVLAGAAFFYRRFRGREGMGLGDAKLLAAAGAWTGWTALPFVLLIAAASGLLYALSSSAIMRLPLNRRIAFGPFIAAGFWLCWLAETSGALLSGAA